MPFGWATHYVGTDSVDGQHGWARALAPHARMTAGAVSVLSFTGDAAIQVAILTDIIFISIQAIRAELEAFGIEQNVVLAGIGAVSHTFFASDILPDISAINHAFIWREIA